MTVNTYFRKRPVVVEAFQMTEQRRWDNADWPNWLHAAWNKEPGEHSMWIDQDKAPSGEHSMWIGTKEGVHRVSWNDWIIKGVQGELYPCKPDIFMATYEPANAP